jgi:hypothetical protein
MHVMTGMQAVNFFHNLLTFARCDDIMQMSRLTDVHVWRLVRQRSDSVRGKYVIAYSLMVRTLAIP